VNGFQLRPKLLNDIFVSSFLIYCLITDKPVPIDWKNRKTFWHFNIAINKLFPFKSLKFGSFSQHLKIIFLLRPIDESQIQIIFFLFLFNSSSAFIRMLWCDHWSGTHSTDPFIYVCILQWTEDAFETNNRLKESIEKSIILI
jgi:hypothetical protein